MKNILVFKSGVVLEVDINDPGALIDQMSLAINSTPVGTNIVAGKDYWLNATDLVFMMPSNVCKVLSSETKE